MTFEVHTASERPDLWERGVASDLVWPEYNLHGDVLNTWWGLLDGELGDFQFVLYDTANDEVVAEGHTGPFWWDGSDETLPDGIDTAIELIFTELRAAKSANTLCALAAESPRSARGRGLAVQLLTAIREIAGRHRLTHLVAPVRPSWKEKYPLADIEHYARWRRDDGQLLDPWMRAHERLGARSRRLRPPQVFQARMSADLAPQGGSSARTDSFRLSPTQATAECRTWPRPCPHNARTVARRSRNRTGAGIMCVWRSRRGCRSIRR